MKNKIIRYPQGYTPSNPSWSWTWDGTKWNQTWNPGTPTKPGGATVMGAPSPGPAPTTPGTTIGQISGRPVIKQIKRRPHPGKPFPGRPFPYKPFPGKPFPYKPFPGKPQLLKLQSRRIARTKTKVKR